MIGNFVPRIGSNPAPARLPADTLTRVELTWIEKRIEHWIRFGHIADEHILDRKRRIVSFAPGNIFAFARWAANDYGTIISRIDIVRAVAPGAPYQTLPFVRPGGDILLKVTGWPKVERVLQAVDAIEALYIDPVDVAPDYWRHVHNRLTVAQEPRSYTRTQHHAWRLRQRAEPWMNGDRPSCWRFAQISISTHRSVRRARPGSITGWSNEILCRSRPAGSAARSATR